MPPHPATTYATCPHTLPHAPTPYHMFPPLPHVSIHSLGLTPFHVPRPLPHAPTPCHHLCHMSPHPATCPHTLPHVPTPATCLRPFTRPDPLSCTQTPATCPHTLPHATPTPCHMHPHPATCPYTLPHVFPVPKGKNFCLVEGLPPLSKKKFFLVVQDPWTCPSFARAATCTPYHILPLAPITCTSACARAPTATSARAPLHERSCSPLLELVHQFAHRALVQLARALVQLSTTLHERSCTSARADCSTTRKFFDFLAPHRQRLQQVQIISIMKNSGGVSPPPPNRITTPYSFPVLPQADKEFTIQVNLHDQFARPENRVFCSPPPLSAKSSNDFDYAKLCRGVPTTCKKN